MFCLDNCLIFSKDWPWQGHSYDFIRQTGTITSGESPSHPMCRLMPAGAGDRLSHWLVHSSKNCAVGNNLFIERNQRISLFDHVVSRDGQTETWWNISKWEELSSAPTARWWECEGCSESWWWLPWSGGGSVAWSRAQARVPGGRPLLCQPRPLCGRDSDPAQVHHCRGQSVCQAL